MRAAWLCLLFLGCSAACRPQTREGSSSSEALPRRFRYTVSVNAELTQLDATVCFDGPSARELRAGKDDAATHLTYARWLSPGSVHRLPVVDGRIQLDPGVDDACVAYGIDLSEDASISGSIRKVGRDLLASPNAWLWRPQRRSADSAATLELKLAEGVRASVPWPKQGKTYQLTGEAFRFDSYAAFGRFEPFVVEHRGARLEVALLDGEVAIDVPAAKRWLARTVEITSGVDGSFPCPRAQILIVPSGSSSEPVLFGTVARGGAGSVMLFMSSTATEEALIGDWVLPHELSHLLLPFVQRDAAWLPEGFATYYQEVLLSRAGVRSEQATLRDLTKALASAREEGTGRNMDDESQAMYSTYAFRAVYWGGAAYFLMADAELRRRSEGKMSLDRVVAKLRERPDRETKTWQADELLVELDRLAGLDVFVPLSKASLGRPFPDYEPVLEAMGVRDGGKSLDDSAPLAKVRRAIFGPAALKAP